MGTTKVGSLGTSWYGIKYDDARLREESIFQFAFSCIFTKIKIEYPSLLLFTKKKDKTQPIQFNPIQSNPNQYKTI